jgi:hypothetical protein
MKQTQILGGLLGFFCIFCTFLHAQTAPSTYSAYTGTDVKTIPPAPALGPANSVIQDPSFGSMILRVCDLQKLRTVWSGRRSCSINHGNVQKRNDSAAPRLRSRLRRHEEQNRSEITTGFSIHNDLQMYKREFREKLLNRKSNFFGDPSLSLWFLNWDCGGDPGIHLQSYGLQISCNQGRKSDWG